MTVNTANQLLSAAAAATNTHLRSCPSSDSGAPQGTIDFHRRQMCSTQLRPLPEDGAAQQVRSFSVVKGIMGTSVWYVQVEWTTSAQNNGKCQDRINGSGECICKEGFHGTACETCEAGRYGKDCKSECDCVHGKCNDGLNGDGFCQCDKGWTGYTCEIDLKTDLCNGSCSIYAK
ncbi:unnamed protein product [Ranitomeya imitator]|uniref:EGF-like domain-containing protein n=1 Tax=Ranitomeya imitator TaxID=111125 RepID=A0ABN9L6L8_9NEOB|nr:unnamed protein product [Ranitomeya imitator]